MRDPLTGSHAVDLCVVGGGITGVMAALSAAEQGARVLLLEAAHVGAGASGRSGGQVQAGFAADMEVLEAQQNPERSQALFAISRDAVASVRDRIRRHGITCGLQSGHITAAISPRHVGYLDHMMEEWESYGAASVLDRLDRTAIAEAIPDAPYLGGVRDRSAAHLNPYAYVVGLAKAAEAAGVRIAEHSPMRRFSAQEDGAPLAGPVRIVTDQAEITAERVILAGNAYLWGRGSGAPSALERILMPVGTYQIATAPLGAERLAALLPGGEAVADLKFVLNYYRPDPPSTRLIFGGGVSYSRLDPPRLAAQLRREMLRWLPSLANVPVTHAWGGHVGITINRLPHVGRLSERVLYAQGYSGHGVALSGQVGAILGTLCAAETGGRADRERSREADRAFADLSAIRHRAFPGGRGLRTPILVAAMAWKRLADLFA